MEFKVESAKDIMKCIFKGIAWGLVSKVLSGMTMFAVSYGGGYGEGTFFFILTAIFEFISWIYFAIGLYDALKLILVAQEKIIKENKSEENNLSKPMNEIEER